MGAAAVVLSTVAAAGATAWVRTRAGGADDLLRVVGGSGRSEEGLLEAAVPWRCPACYTAGRLPCDACGARGKTGGVLSGDPLRPCEKCGARGAVECARCGGTGCVNTWLWTPKPRRSRGSRG